MKLVKPSFEIITPIHGEEILKQIELAARTCYKSEDRIEYEDDIRNHSIVRRNYYAVSSKPLITKLISKGHHAMLEFGGMITVRFICDRGISHELIRHRLCSFAQESTRYCNYGKSNEVVFIEPFWLKDIPERYVERSAESTDPIERNDSAAYYYEFLEIAEETYIRLLKDGWTPQQARSVLPNSLKTDINVSANIREWREIFKQRTDKAAHPQMRELMIPLLERFKELIPILFDDINY